MPLLAHLHEIDIGTVPETGDLLRYFLPRVNSLTSTLFQGILDEQHQVGRAGVQPGNLRGYLASMLPTSCILSFDRPNWNPRSQRKALTASWDPSAASNRQLSPVIHPERFWANRAVQRPPLPHMVPGHTVGIVVFHPEVMPLPTPRRMIKSIGPNAKMSVTKSGRQVRCHRAIRHDIFSAVDHDEVVPGAVVFSKNAVSKQ